MTEHRTGTPLTQVRFAAAARDFSPTVNFQCRLSYGVHTPTCAVACIYICAHVKDLVIHVRFRCTMETLKHSACTVGCVARLCRSWLSPGKTIRISLGRNPIGAKSHYYSLAYFHNSGLFIRNRYRFEGTSVKFPYMSSRKT